MSSSDDGGSRELSDDHDRIEPSGAPGAAAVGMPDLVRVLETLPDAVLVLASSGRVLYANAKAFELLKLERSGLIPDVRWPTTRTLLDEGGEAITWDRVAMWRRLGTGTPIRETIIGIDDGTQIAWLVGRGEPLRDGAGTVTGVVMTFAGADELKLGREIDRGTRELATALVERPLGQTDEMTDGHLRTLGEASRADRAVCVMLDHGAGRARSTHNWSRTGSPLRRVPGGVPIDMMAPLLGYVARHKPVVLADSDQLAEPTMSSSRLEAWGLRSAVVAPVMVADSLAGLMVIGWDQAFAPPRQLVDFVVVAADLYAARLDCERSHEQLVLVETQLAERDLGTAAGRALAEEVERPEVVLPDLLAEVDDDGLLVKVHDPVGSDLPSFDGFIGVPVVDLFDPGRRAEITEKLARVRDNGELQSVEFEWLIQGVNHRFDCRLMAQSSGGVLVVMRDMTELAVFTDRLRDQARHYAQINEDLERVVRERDEFLATISHELRTPLNAILGMTEMLIEDDETPLSDHHLSQLHTIDFSGRQLRDLINELLDLSGMRAQLATLHLGPMAIGQVCRETVQSIASRVAQHQLSIEFVDGSSELVINADERRLRQVLMSLLDNAVKFTEPGGAIGMHVWRTDDDHVAASVWDTGIGMASSDHQRIFEPFIQLDGGLDRLRPGTGLGLALAERVVELHGGRIELESEPGQGSRFTVVLPIGGPPSS